MLRLSTVVIAAGLIGLAGCDASPTEPTSLTANPSRQTMGGAVQLEPAERSAQSQQDYDRVRALIAALSDELSSSGGGDPSPPPNDPMTVAILGTRGSDSFSPNPVSPGGRTLVWRNDHAFIHRIVADDGSFDTGNLAAGATSSEVQAPAGGVGYHCSIHPTMVGSIGDGGGTGGGGGGVPYALGDR